MEKNKKFGSAVREGGARYYHAAGENGYALNSDLPFSNGKASYPNAPNQTPINYDGMENFNDNTRFTGDVGGQPRTEASDSQRDSIETGGGGGDELNRKAY